jgi:hypothetical protein
MMEKSALSDEAGGCTPTPFHSNTITNKVAVYALEGRYTRCISSPPYMYSVLKSSCQSTAGRPPYWRAGWEEGRLEAWHWARWRERWGRGRGRSRSACQTSAWRGSTWWRPGAPAPAPLLSAACQQAFPFTSVPVYKHFTFTGIPVYKHICLQAFPFTSIPIYKHFRLQAFPLQAFPFTEISVYKHSHLQAFPFTMHSRTPLMNIASGCSINIRHLHITLRSRIGSCMLSVTTKHSFKMVVHFYT